MSKLATIGRTMRVAHKLKASEAGELAMAVELIDIRLPGGGQELSLVARRSLLLMLEAAAGDAWKYEFHRIAKQDLRGKHATMLHVRAAFDELMGVWFSQPATLDEKPATRRFHLLDEITDHVNGVVSAFVEFRFSQRACQLLKQSDVYARLSREAIVKFRSSYALRMYEIGSALYARRDPVWRGNVAALRKLLHVPDGTYTNFADLRKRVLEPARDELGQLAEFVLAWTERKKGRQVLAVELFFSPKTGRMALTAAEENQRHSSGRQVRRGGTTEAIVNPAAVAGLIGRATARLTTALAWPADDVISPYVGDGELHRIAVEHGGGHAVERIATAYVRHLGGKRRELTGGRLRSSWQGFCEAKTKQWGSVPAGDSLRS
jgi:hypothetical protein